jgi:hypothetical protein
MRVELDDGQWVELRDRISHGQDKEIRRARMRAKDSPEDAIAEDITVSLRVFIKAWNVNDPDGNPIPLTDADAIERMPHLMADELIGHILPLYMRATVPNAPTPLSSGGSSSATRSRRRKSTN